MQPRFVIVLSDQPQGGIKFRKRRPPVAYGYERPGDRQLYWGSPTRSPFSIW
ncbi:MULTISPECIES: hypothetical protein [Bradyrhizobium]|uniref:hypothetical protein n=1 Tax=Bradyrhizobium TaxID=374 RepID=UPI001CE30369|nr:hypothetical protein [Bradyrhizobium australafricanum]MCA6100851.1 hypothetical protein [Bradyrhizobium australafricanum]